MLDGLYLSSSIVDLNNIESTLNSEVSAQQVYTVQSGDAPTLIAQKTNTHSEELKRLNPGIEDSLLIGQEVLISKSVPFLAVETVRTEIYEEEIDFKVEQVVDASQYKGYNQIQNYGSKGEKRIVAQVTYLDGVETDREILSTEVLKSR